MARAYKDLTVSEIVQINSLLKSGERKAAIAQQFGISNSTVGTVDKNTGSLSLTDITALVASWHVYRKVLAKVFGNGHVPGGTGPIPFTSRDVADAKAALGFTGGNPYDLKYNAKGRGALSPDVQKTAPVGQEWRIVSTGKGEYEFRLYLEGSGVFELDPAAPTIKLLNAVPALIERYLGEDEQALLAKIRYNNLVTAFLGIHAQSLQAHWKTSLAGSGPVEIDELYVAVDAVGRHYIVALEAKSREKSEKITAEQLLRNYHTARARYPKATVRVVAAKVIDDDTFVMLLFDVDEETEEISKVSEYRYVLAANPAVKPRPILADDELAAYGPLAEGDEEPEAEG